MGGMHDVSSGAALAPTPPDVQSQAAAPEGE